MTTTERTDLVTDWNTWHAERERVLAEPHGWLSLTGLYWLDTTDRAYADLPGTWRTPGDGTVELTTAPDDGIRVDGAFVYGSTHLEPVDGAPGVMVEIGDRRVELARREHHVALRIRDPKAPTRTAFTGVPAFPVDERWIVPGRFSPYAEPVRIDVETVIDGLGFHPTAVGTVAFDLDGERQQLVALQAPDGLKLHFRDGTSGEETYGGGRQVTTSAPDDEGRFTVDLNRTVNLPCALSDFATCPLPPAANTVTVRVEAGETLPD